MDCWMDGLLELGRLRLAGPGGSRPAWPSTIFPTSFDMDFPMHFGMDLASILEPFLMIFPSFGTDIFAFGFSIEFYRISTEFRDPQTMENSIITWDSLKKQKNCIFGFSINFVSDFTSISASFWKPFCMFFEVFMASNFGCNFGCVFLWVLAPSRHPDDSQNGPKFLEKLRIGFSSTAP